MLKFLARIAEKYAKSSNTACFFFGIIHQPKMPASMIKKDQNQLTKLNYNDKKYLIYLGIFICVLNF